MTNPLDGRIYEFNRRKKLASVSVMASLITRGVSCYGKLIEEKAMTRISGPPEKMQQQSGVFNLWARGS